MNSLSVLLTGVACSPGESESIATSVADIVGQTLGQTQFMGRWSNNDTSAQGTGRGYRALALTAGGPNDLFWSYATGLFWGQGGCSGTFVGRNLLLTAGHCGHTGFAGVAAGFFQSRLYSEGSEDADISNVSCQTLVQNHNFGDFQLASCDDVLCSTEARASDCRRVST